MSFLVDDVLVTLDNLQTSLGQFPQDTRSTDEIVSIKTVSDGCRLP